jgi:two-component system cell cycle response regulator DivK
MASPWVRRRTALAYAMCDLSKVRPSSRNGQIGWSGTGERAPPLSEISAPGAILFYSSESALVRASFRKRKGAMHLKILLVEDDEMNRDMLSRRLELEGYQVVSCRDGLEGLALVDTEAPALVLMDMSLPQLDGWETTRRLKARASGQHVPVIALTAHAMAGDREKALQAGCDDFDTKPIDWKRLMKKMTTLLNVEAPR